MSVVIAGAGIGGLTTAPTSKVTTGVTRWLFLSTATSRACRRCWCTLRHARRLWTTRGTWFGDTTLSDPARAGLLGKAQQRLEEVDPRSAIPRGRWCTGVGHSLALEDSAAINPLLADVLARTAAAAH